MSMRWITPVCLGIPALAFILGLIVPSVARAGEPRTHDGFFLRLSGGGGYASTSVNDARMELKLSGTSGDINLAIGGIVGRNLALHGTLFGWAVSDPDAEFNGLDVGKADGDITMSAFGGGVTYYFMPANIYISPSVGLATLSFDGDQDGSSDSGFAIDITLAKEWWVGNSWGLGVAGAFGYHSIPDGDIDENWSGTSFGVRFSATLN